MDNDFGPEKDVVSLMAWDTPPWKHPRSNRDRWLRKDDESHRRRVQQVLGRKAARRPVPGATSTARGSTNVVTVDADALSHDDALHLWMQILELRDMGAEPNNYGLPQYHVDNLAATLEDLDASDLTTLLSAYGRVQGICQAQVATAANARLQRLKKQSAALSTRRAVDGAPGGQDEEEEDEWTSMVQTATALHTVQGGLSTFAIHLQTMTDQFSEMARPRQVIRSALLRGRLAGRYGTGTGRRSMGSVCRDARRHGLCSGNSCGCRMDQLVVAYYGRSHATSGELG